jgi:hypothetical protein
MKRTKQEVADYQNPKWKYTPSVSTNIMARFKTLGWIPPSEKEIPHLKRKG